MNLFAEMFKEENRKEHFEELKNMLFSFLIERGRTNGEIYRFILRKGYLPKHVNAVLRCLQDCKLIKVTLLDLAKEARKGSFYINYDASKDIKHPKVLIELKYENNKD